MAVIRKDLGTVTAYAYAVSKGYTGTEAEFAELMASYAEVAEEAAASASAASASSTSAGQAASAAAQSATAAAQSAASIEGDVQTATQKAAEATAAAGQAVTAKDAAVTAQTAAETAATNAGQSASTATAKASEAATSASNAARSKTDAEASATRAEQAAASLTVDDALSDTSENPVQNKVITGEVTQLKSHLEEISNLNFLPSKATISGYCSNTGSFNTDGTVYHRTDYLPVTTGQKIRTGKIRFVTYFKSDKTYDSGVSVPSANTENIFTVPVTGYVIISVYNSTITDGTLFGTFGDSFNIFTEKALAAITDAFPTIYQTTGKNTDGIMSQKAITDAITFAFNSLGTLANASIYAVTRNGAYIIIDETVTGKPETGVGYLAVFKPNSGFSLLMYYAYPTKTLYIGVGYNGALYGSWSKINATILQNTGSSKTATMSQKAITDAINASSGGNVEKIHPLLFKDKTIVVLGDSIFGNNDSDTGVSAVMQTMLEGTVKNCAFGGTRFTARSQVNGYEQFDFANLVNCIINNDYTPLNNAIASYSLPGYYQSRVNRLAGIDFSTVDKIFLFYGTNDYTSGITESVFTSSVIASIDALQSAYKQAQIIVCAPAWRFWYTTEDGTGTYQDDSDTRNFGGGTLIQYATYIKNIAESCHCPFISAYNIGINKNNYAQYFNDHDGTHHDVAGRALLAEYLARQLIAIA